MKVKDYKAQIDSYLDNGNMVWFMNDETNEILASLYSKTEWYEEIFDKLGDCDINHHRSFCRDLWLYIKTDISLITKSTTQNSQKQALKR